MSPVSSIRHRFAAAVLAALVTFAGVSAQAMDITTATGADGRRIVVRVIRIGYAARSLRPTPAGTGCGRSRSTVRVGRSTRPSTWRCSWIAKGSP